MTLESSRMFLSYIVHQKDNSDTVLQQYAIDIEDYQGEIEFFEVSDLHTIEFRISHQYNFMYKHNAVEVAKQNPNALFSFMDCTVPTMEAEAFIEILEYEDEFTNEDSDDGSLCFQMDEVISFQEGKALLTALKEQQAGKNRKKMRLVKRK